MGVGYLMGKLRQREVRFSSVLTVYAPDANSMIDMMRYDRGHPLRREDAEKIVRLIERRSGGERQPEDRIVQILRTSSNNDDPSERWRSFGCSILDVRAPDVPAMTEAELAELATHPKIVRRPVARRRCRRPVFVSLLSVSATSAEAVIRVMQREHCCPLQEMDSGKIEALAGRRERPGDRLIRLVRFAPSNSPTDDDACRELGCDLLDERNLFDPGPSDTELAHLAALPFGLRGREVRR